MITPGEKSFDPKAEFVRKVAREAGVSEEEVGVIISMVGYNESSIVREARILKRGDR